MTEERGFNANYSAKYSRFARVTFSACKNPHAEGFSCHDRSALQPDRMTEFHQEAIRVSHKWCGQAVLRPR